MTQAQVTSAVVLLGEVYDREITRGDLITLLSTIRGAAPVTITAATDPRLRKTGLPDDLRGARKISRVNGVVNWHYEAAVNRQQVREGGDGTFEAQPRKWGVRVAGTPFVEHKGALYLELKVERTLGHVYVDAAGQPVEYERVAPFLSEKRSNAEHQGVEREIVLRDYAIESIQAIAIGGGRYRVVG